MRFLSLDIETTGLDENYCQILEIGAVMGDLSDTPVDDLPSLCIRLFYDKVVGQPYALHMNAKLILDMEKRIDVIGSYRYHHPDSAWSALSGWLPLGEKLTVAGKNYGSFDRRFLSRIPQWDHGRFHHRYLDPAMLFWRPGSDTVLPDTAECIKRAGIKWDNRILHNARSDARLVVELIRAGLGKYTLMASHRNGPWNVIASNISRQKAEETIETFQNPLNTYMLVKEVAL